MKKKLQSYNLFLSLKVLKIIVSQFAHRKNLKRYNVFSNNIDLAKIAQRFGTLTPFARLKSQKGLLTSMTHCKRSEILQ